MTHLIGTYRDGKSVVQCPCSDWILYSSRDAFAAALALWKKHEMLEKVQAAALAREQKETKSRVRYLSFHNFFEN